jgi:hypothetical protein
MATCIKTVVPGFKILLLPFITVPEKAKYEAYPAGAPESLGGYIIV